MDSIVRWYIERAMDELDRPMFKDEGVYEIFVDETIKMYEEDGEGNIKTILRALELAVKDVG